MGQADPLVEVGFLLVLVGRVLKGGVVEAPVVVPDQDDLDPLGLQDRLEILRDGEVDVLLQGPGHALGPREDAAVPRVDHDPEGGNGLDGPGGGVRGRPGCPGALRGGDQGGREHELPVHQLGRVGQAHRDPVHEGAPEPRAADQLPGGVGQDGAAAVGLLPQRHPPALGAVLGAAILGGTGCHGARGRKRQRRPGAAAAGQGGGEEEQGDHVSALHDFLQYSTSIGRFCLRAAALSSAFIGTRLDQGRVWRGFCKKIYSQVLDNK